MVSVTKSVADREKRRAGGGDDEQRRLDTMGAEAIEQQAERQLDRGEGKEIDRGEEAEAGGIDADLGGDGRADDGIHDAEEMREEIAEGEGEEEAGRNHSCLLPAGRHGQRRS